MRTINTQWEAWQSPIASALLSRLSTRPKNKQPSLEDTSTKSCPSFGHSTQAGTAGSYEREIKTVPLWAIFLQEQPAKSSHAKNSEV